MEQPLGVLTEHKVIAVAATEGNVGELVYHLS